MSPFTIQTFDAILRKLGRYSSRRRLFGDESYIAAYLMGQLTTQCYEEASDTGPVARSTTLTSKTKTDHTAGMYLMLIAKCSVTFDSPTITITQYGLGDGKDVRTVLPYDKLQILGKVYSVLDVSDDGRKVRPQHFP